jgi:hypothetical protein
MPSKITPERVTANEGAESESSAPSSGRSIPPRFRTTYHVADPGSSNRTGSGLSWPV